MGRRAKPRAEEARSSRRDGLAEAAALEQALKLQQQLTEEAEVARVFAAHFTAVSAAKRKQLDAASAQIQEMQTRGGKHAKADTTHTLEGSEANGRPRRAHKRSTSPAGARANGRAPEPDPSLGDDEAAAPNEGGGGGGGAASTDAAPAREDMVVSLEGSGAGFDDAEDDGHHAGAGVDYEDRSTSSARSSSRAGSGSDGGGGDGDDAGGGSDDEGSRSRSRSRSESRNPRSRRRSKRSRSPSVGAGDGGGAVDGGGVAGATDGAEAAGGGRKRSRSRSRDRDRKRPRPVAKVRRVEELTVDDTTRRLFMRALEVWERRGCRKGNISVLNDIMRQEDRDWYVVDRTQGTFAMLCQRFEQEGLVKLGRRRDDTLLLGTRSTMAKDEVGNEGRASADGKGAVGGDAAAGDAEEGGTRHNRRREERRDRRLRSQLAATAAPPAPVRAASPPPPALGRDREPRTRSPPPRRGGGGGGGGGRVPTSLPPREASPGRWAGAARGGGAEPPLRYEDRYARGGGALREPPPRFDDRYDRGGPLPQLPAPPPGAYDPRGPPPPMGYMERGREPMMAPHPQRGYERAPLDRYERGPQPVGDRWGFDADRERFAVRRRSGGEAERWGGGGGGERWR